MDAQRERDEKLLELVGDALVTYYDGLGHFPIPRPYGAARALLDALKLSEREEAAYRTGREDALRWAADRIDPGPRVANVARDADRVMVFVIDADRGTATKLRLWADATRCGLTAREPES